MTADGRRRNRRTGPVSCLPTGGRVGGSSVRTGGSLLATLLAATTICSPRAAPSLQAPVVGAEVAYPQAELRAGIGGSADIDCTITRQGLVSDCVVLRASSPAFARTALDFVRHARYSPATHDGVPVDQRHHVWTIKYDP